METQHEKSLRLLREYLQEATPEEKQKLIDEISAQGIEGPTVEQYFEDMVPASHYVCSCHCATYILDVRQRIKTCTNCGNSKRF